MFRTVGDEPSLWESVLPEELLRLPEELARVDALLDDPVFLAFLHLVAGGTSPAPPPATSGCGRRSSRTWTRLAPSRLSAEWPPLRTPCPSASTPGNVPDPGVLCCGVSGGQFGSRARPAVLTSGPSWGPRAVGAISAGCTAELNEPAHQKEYAQGDGEDVPTAQTVTDCVKGVGHDDEQPDEH